MQTNPLPARTGATWVRSGLQTFAKRPLAFMALFFFFMMLVSIASRIPLLGTVLALMLLPAMTLGVMAAAASVAEIGATPTSANVFMAAIQAVRTDARPLAVLGALYAVLFLAVMGLSALVDGGQFARIYLLGEPVSREIAERGDFQVALWLAMALYLPLSLAFWHAPALVHWHRVTPAKSLFFSFVACFRTMGALTVFGVAWMGVFLGAGILLSLVASVLASAGIFGSGGAAAAAGTLMVGGAMVMAAMFFTSIWFSFRATFDAESTSASADSH
jgi:hypothetical protein